MLDVLLGLDGFVDRLGQAVDRGDALLDLRDPALEFLRFGLEDFRLSTVLLGVALDPARFLSLARELDMEIGQLRILEAQSLLELEHDVLEPGRLFLKAAEDGEVLERRLGRQARRPDALGLGGLGENDGEIGHHARSLPIPHAGPLSAFGTDEAIGAEGWKTAQVFRRVRSQDLVALEYPIFHGKGIIKEGRGSSVS